MLFLGGRQDVIAGTLDVSIGNVTTFLQIAALVGPPIAYVVALAPCAGSLTAAAGRSAPSGPAASCATPSAATTTSSPTTSNAARIAPRSGRWASDARRRPRPPPLTEQAADIDRVWDGFLIAGLAVGAARRRARDARPRCASAAAATTLPRQVHEHIPLEIFYTAVPLLIVAGLFAVTFVSVQRHRRGRRRRRARRRGHRVPVAVAVRLPGVRRRRSSGTDAESPELVLPARHVGALRPPLGRRHPLVLDPRVPLQARRVPRRDTVVLRSTSGRAPGRSRTPACAPSSAGSTTQDALLGAHRDARRVRPVAATEAADRDRARTHRRRAAVGRRLPGAGRRRRPPRRPAADADRVADDDRPQGDRHRLRRHGARVPRHRRRAGRASSAPSSPSPACSSSTRRPTTACSRSTAA